jgi:hypothetical protein
LIALKTHEQTVKLCLPFNLIKTELPSALLNVVSLSGIDESLSEQRRI